MTANSTHPTQETNYEFNIQRIYVKDLSFEAPHIPEIFKQAWDPEVELDLNSEAKHIEDTLHEVVLTIVVTVKVQKKLAFLIEVKQAGLFVLHGFNENQLSQMLGSYCPNILFPYARELVSETICRGSFPPLYLAPINFDALHEEKTRQENSN